MQSLLVLVVAVGVAVADVSHLGYHYDVPHTSYGVPSYPTSGNSQYNTGSNYHKGQSGSQQGVYQGGSGYQGLSANHGAHSGYQGQSVSQGVYQGQSVAHGAQGGYQGQAASQGAQGGYYQGQGLSSNTGYQQATHGGNYQAASNGGQYHDSGAHASVQKPSYQVSNTAQGGQGAYQYQSSYQSAAAQNYQTQYSQQAPQIYKHFYVHAAPEEPEVIKHRAPVNLPAPQKHYKIIVIKAPTAPAYTAPIVPIQPVQEEKTIVYVLSKKPEEYQDVVVPKIEQRPPSKPEVYFIKYNTKEESQAAINNIVDNYQKDSVSFAGTGISSNEGTLSSFGSQLSSGSSSSVGEVSNDDLSSQIAATFDDNTGAHALNLGVVNTGSSSISSGNEISHVSSSGSSQGYESSTGSNGGYVSGVSSGDASGSASGVSYDVNSVSTSQGIPHASYGPPKFRD